VRDGENIYLVPPAAPAAMAEAVRVLRGDDALRHKLATGAASLARSFSWDAIAQETLKLFESTR
jgi:glycosyltransferase involved in cell wall biosynthesis